MDRVTSTLCGHPYPAAESNVLARLTSGRPARALVPPARVQKIVPMSEDHPICVQCGVQYGAQHQNCMICEDERQYVNWDGQQWTTLRELRATGYQGDVRPEGPGVFGVGTRPSLAIGQRALLVRAPTGNVLWDCVSYLDGDLIAEIERLGGISAIAISHPHFYGSMIEWADAFDAPVYLHAADREWVARPDDHIVFWEGEVWEFAPGLTLINAGVHFDGGTVLHRDSDGGALFSGDIATVAADRGWVSFMYSYPNYIPERPEVIRRAVRLLDDFRFERVYGGWWRRIVDSDGSNAIRRSARRYLRQIAED